VGRPLLALIHTREPPRRPGDDLPAWEPNWPVWGWAAAAALLGYAALSADGLIGVLVIFAAFAAGCRALALALPYDGGLRDWQQ
jgi:hypothetical protein